jgi:hypothetical protein
MKKNRDRKISRYCPFNIKISSVFSKIKLCSQILAELWHQLITGRLLGTANRERPSRHRWTFFFVRMSSHQPSHMNQGDY